MVVICKKEQKSTTASNHNKSQLKRAINRVLSSSRRSGTDLAQNFYQIFTAISARAINAIQRNNKKWNHPKSSVTPLYTKVNMRTCCLIWRQGEGKCTPQSLLLQGGSAGGFRIIIWFIGAVANVSYSFTQMVFFWVYVSLSLYLTTPGRPREDLDRWELCCRRNSGERSCLTIVTIVKLHEKIKKSAHTPGSTFSVTCPISERKKLRPLTNDFLHSVFETLVSYRHCISWDLVRNKK